jgi:succinyl-diaminopimelate desuccinylase
VLHASSPTPASLEEALAERTLALVDVPSVSRDEARIAELVVASMPVETLEQRHADGEAFFYTTRRRPGFPLVVLAGHLDTIPAQDNLPGRIEDGYVVGLGATDMKGGLAVMLELARWLDEAQPARTVDVGMLFFTREELPVAESPLPRVFAACEELRGADFAIVLEPTNNTIQAGCLGNVNATLTFRGVSAHSARPWLGVNAIGVAASALVPITEIAPMPVQIGDLEFVEVLSVTRIDGGIADNVIPDAVACRLNFRFAPGRSPEDAVGRLRELVGDVGKLDVTSVSPAANVPAGSELLDRLRAAGDLSIEPKQAWTPVAQFSEQGIDAVNFGPGATVYAHRQDERVSTVELRRTFEALQRFIAG